MRAALFALVVLSGCTWSNSLYQAKRLSTEAIELERRNRPFEAQTVWGRAAVKADSAYARDPGGVRGAEALWLRGRGRARSGDCAAATRSLESALTAAPSAKWRDELELELGSCLHRLGDPQRAMQFFERLQGSDNQDIRRAARLAAARSHVAARRWEAALTSLEGIDTASARMDRAVALVALQRRTEGFRELEPLLATPDSVRDWTVVVEAFAATDPMATDSLLTTLKANGSVRGARLGPLLLAAARGATGGMDESAGRRLGELAAAQDEGLAVVGRLMLAERLLSRSTSPASLRSAMDSVRVLATDDGAAAIRFAAIGAIGERLVTQHDSLVAGAPQGDMLTFVHAELARDSLKAPALANYFFARLERDWPTSPYAPKALLARMPLDPDSVDVLRARITNYPDSPYLAYLQGRENEQFTALEVALVTFAELRRPRRDAPGRVRPVQPGATPGVDIP